MPYTPPTPDYTEPRGTGDRRVDILVTPSPAFGGGIPSNLVDGNTGANSSDAVFFTSGLASMDIEFDFGPSSSVLITEITWRQNNTTSHGTWQWQGWNGSGWDDLGSTFTLGGSTAQVITTMSAVTTPYRIYRLHKTGGANTSSSPWLLEIEFKISEQNEFATISTNAGGSGDRTGFMAVTTTATLGGSSGVASNLVNGSIVADNTGSIWFTSGQSGRVVVFDFNTPKVIDKLMWLQQVAGSQGSWRIAGSNDGVTEDEVLLQIAGDSGSDDFAVGGTVETIARFVDTLSGSPNPGFRYYIMTQVSGTTGTQWIQEVIFAVAGIPAAPPGPGSQQTVVCIICS